MGQTRGSLPIELTTLQLVCLVLMVSYLSIVAIKVRLAWHYIVRQDTGFRNQELTAGEAAQFVIAQPILSGDPCLADSLRQNVARLPKQIRFLWLVDELDPAGREIANSVGKSFENVEVLICPPAKENENPKTFKLRIALSKADRKMFVVLDDDTQIDQTSLVAAMQAFSRFDLYTGLPVYRSAENIWGNLVAQFVNNQSVLTYLPLLNFLPPLSINGMFYVFQTSKLKEIGGFEPVVRELCDDYAIKSFVTRHGWRIRQGISFQSVSTSVANARHYAQIMHRWLVFSLLLVRDQPLLTRVTLAFLLGLPSFLFLATTIISFTSWSTLAMLAGFLCIRQILLSVAPRIARAPGLSFHPLTSILAELAQPLQILSALVWPTIRWRNRRIRVGTGQNFRILPESDH